MIARMSKESPKNALSILSGVEIFLDAPLIVQRARDFRRNL